VAAVVVVVVAEVAAEVDAVAVEDDGDNRTTRGEKDL